MSTKLQRRSNVRKQTTDNAYRRAELKYAAQNPEKRKFSNIKCDANRAEIAFHLELTDVFHMFRLPCHFCNAVRNSTKDGIMSIGRVDKTKPWTLDNVTPCCKTCNNRKPNVAPEVRRETPRTKKLTEKQLLSQRVRSNRHYYKHLEVNRLRNRRKAVNYRNSPKFAEYMKQFLVSDAYKWATLKTCAKSKNLTVTITEEEASLLFASPCHYCGISADKPTSCYGIDRKDNRVGYTKENCVPCCTTCNFSKSHRLSVSDFVNQCYRISAHQMELPAPKTTIDQETKTSSYQSYVHRAKVKGIDFTLTVEDYQILVSSDCTYCGYKPIKTIGIDRIDSDKGYIQQNTVACCKVCNYMKGRMDVDDFYAHCFSVAKHNKLII